MSARKSTNTQKAKKTQFPTPAVHFEISRELFDSIVSIHMNVLRLMALAAGEGRYDMLPIAEFGRRFAKASAKSLQGYVRSCPADYRTLLAAEVVLRVFDACMATGKKTTRRAA